MRRRSPIIALGLVALVLPVAAWADDASPAPKGLHPAPHTEITPYIEADQVLSAEIAPGNDVVTYTTLAAGVDATVIGKNSAISASVRYERYISESSGTSDSDAISGVVRASVALVPHAVTIEAGALASSARVDSSGAAFSGTLAHDSATSSKIYSGYIGPSVETQLGDLQVEAHYRFGYTKVQEPDAVVVGTTGLVPFDLADESTTHNAQARIGFRPYTILPVGVGVGGMWNEQDVSNLDQRVRDRNVHGDVTVPVSPSLAFAGGVGYEDVEVSSRDAVRNAAGNPVIGKDGRYVTDKSAPRTIAYQTDGLIWDVGVMWRPSKRTSLEAYVGRRYDSTTYYGTFAYAPNSRESINVSVYDGISSFGGVITDRLAGMPAQFTAVRNALSGDIGGCVASLEGGSCPGSIGSLESAAFRSQGISASYAIDLGRTTAGLGVGYDRRKFIAAPSTVLASADGVVDDTWWGAVYVSTKLDARSSIHFNATETLFDSGFDGSGGRAVGYSASLAYYREIIAGLSGTAAAGIDGVTQESLPDIVSASALLGLRYSF
ncbi:MAG: preprotein translocase subunit YajC [Croceibacterium sp.]